MFTGLFISVGVTRYGPERFRTELINIGDGTIKVGPLFGWVLQYLIPVQFAIMFGWWMYQAVAVYDPDNWWNPIRMYSLGTCLLQWGLALVLLWLFNRRLAATSLAPPAAGVP